MQQVLYPGVFRADMQWTVQCGRWTVICDQSTHFIRAAVVLVDRLLPARTQSTGRADSGVGVVAVSRVNSTAFKRLAVLSIASRCSRIQQL